MLSQFSIIIMIEFMKDVNAIHVGTPIENYPTGQYSLMGNGYLDFLIYMKISRDK